MNLTLTLSPSLIGQYFEQQCDRFLGYKSVNKDDLKRLGWVRTKDKKTAAAEAGKKWEKDLLDSLKKDSTCIVNVILKNEEEKKESALERTLNALKSLEKTEKPIYLYQACLSVTPSFEEKYLSDFNKNETKIIFSDTMFPDFIKAEYIHSKQKFRLTVIDAKNASLLKVNAVLQIALYEKILKYILADKGINNCFVNEEEGIVWNREKITNNKLEHVFQLQDAEKEIDIFFSEKLPKIFNIVKTCGTGSQIQKSLGYRISQRCEYCENFDTCKKHCIDESNIRLMPYITLEAQDRIEELIADEKLKDDTIESVKNLLTDNPKLLTNNCNYWKNVANNLNAYVSGIQSAYEGVVKAFPKKSTSISLPKGQNFSLLLTAQQDVYSGRVYAYSWLLKPGKGIDIFDQGLNEYGWADIYERKNACSGKGTYYGSAVALNGAEEEFNRIDKEFVENLYEILCRIIEYSEPKYRKLQLYVMDAYEKYNIESALFNMLDYLEPFEEEEHELIEKVMAILFWIQGDRLPTDVKKQPERCVENPITVITSEVSNLYVLTEEVAYTLRGIATVFSNSKYVTFNEDDDKYFGTLTNVIEGNIIHQAWKEKDEEKRKSIESLAFHLRKRLFVELQIILKLQKENQNRLSLWPMRYEMIKPKYPDYPEIARLYFENRYEQMLAYRQIRMARAGGIQNAIDNGTILWLEYTGIDNTYSILNRENYIGREWFSAWLCEDTEENRLQIMLLQDSKYTGNYGTIKHKIANNDTETIFYPTDFNPEYNFKDNGHDATVDFIPKKRSGFSPVKGKKYLFFEVYSDINSEKTEEGLEKLIDRRELLDPIKLSSSSGVIFNKAIEEICSKFWSPDGFSFSDSQKKAFIHLLEQRLTVLEGPPASGKTDFIARALITIAGYYKTISNKNLKIMVTAMSHSAIENVLLKLDTMLKKQNTCDIRLAKVGKIDDKKAFEKTSVELIGAWRKPGVIEWIDSHKIQIIGMTAWSACKELHQKQMRVFDMIVMDEASQIRAMDAFLNLECSDANTQYLLVGDDKQLQPIIAGKYKEVEGEKYIHGSIFHMYITGLGNNHPDILRLSENFRMNGILCKYLETLYGPEYQAFNDTIKTQKISLKSKPQEDLLAFLLDEEYPLVFCKLTGPAREQEKAEVEIVTKLICELWENQMNPKTQKLAKEERNFWRDAMHKDGTVLEGACGIITPHHEHINRLKTSISAALGIERKDIFIGTVDKLQGKERKTVIVSYGVHQTEKILNESEFIFNLNRFNVSLSRGKAKTIVFLSDAIAEQNMRVQVMTANDKALQKGVDFIHNFAKYMSEKRDGEDLVIKEYPNYNDGDVSLTVWKKCLAGV